MNEDRPCLASQGGPKRESTTDDERLPAPAPVQPAAAAARLLVFGSDQGMIGPFNDTVAQHVSRMLARLPAPVAPPQVHAVGERVAARLADAGMHVIATYPVPASADGIAALVARVQLATETPLPSGEPPVLHVFHNRPAGAGLYEPTERQLLPLDAGWMAALAGRAWPDRRAAQVVGDRASTLRALVGEYLFVTVVRACAESLASENAARLAAMQRAERNIGEVLQRLQAAHRRERQERIDEELFGVLAGHPGQDAELPGRS